MTALGLDLGTKTLGVAISKTGIIANPYKLLKYNNKFNKPYYLLERIFMKRIIETSLGIGVGIFLYKIYEANMVKKYEALFNEVLDEELFK